MMSMDPHIGDDGAPLGEKESDMPGASGPVECLNIPDGRVLRRFGNVMEAQESLGVSSSEIAAVLTGKANNAGGFGWRFGNGKYSHSFQPSPKQTENIFLRLDAERVTITDEITVEELRSLRSQRAQKDSEIIECFAFEGGDTNTIKVVKRFKSIDDAVWEIGVPREEIIACLQGVVKTVRGLGLRYLPQIAPSQPQYQVVPGMNTQYPTGLNHTAYAQPTSSYSKPSSFLLSSSLFF